MNELADLTKIEGANQRYFFTCVIALLRADFLGVPDPDYSGMERDRLEEIEIFKWRGMAFYRMVWANWPSVSRALKKMSLRSLPGIESNEGAQLELFQPNPNEIKSAASLTLEMLRLAAVEKIALTTHRYEIPQGIRDLENYCYAAAAKPSIGRGFWAVDSTISYRKAIKEQDNLYFDRSATPNAVMGVASINEKILRALENKGAIRNK